MKDLNRLDVLAGKLRLTATQEQYKGLMGGLQRIENYLTDTSLQSPQKTHALATVIEKYFDAGYCRTRADRLLQVVENVLAQVKVTNDETDIKKHVKKAFKTYGLAA